LPENIAGGEGHSASWMGHKWVCRAAECGVQSPFVRAMGCR